MRAAGLEARWSRTKLGAPMIVAREPKSKLAHQRLRWWAVDVNMWRTMQKEGIVEGFHRATLLGDVFSVSV